MAAADPDGLERAVAYVITHPGMQATEAELLAFCHDNLASFKRPRRVVLVQEYPTTATGKVRRVDLRTMAAGVLEQSAPGPVSTVAGG